MGTVETAVICLSTIHWPRSGPERTMLRGAGTRVAPWRQASHISSHEASNATDSPAITRSPGPSGRRCRYIWASASTRAAAERWLMATPFGLPVEPEVKMIQASSRVRGVSVRSPVETAERRVSSRPSPKTAATPASSHTVWARSSGSSQSTGT